VTQRQTIYLEEDRPVDYAQLKLGSNFVMLSSTSTDPMGPIPLPPALAGGRSYSASDCEGYVWTFSSRRLT
jgi:hypothetical protein